MNGEHGVYYCPGCGSYIDEFRSNGGVCGYCGFDRNVYAQEKPETIPPKCEDHPKYEGIGVPKVDCLTCWTMHKGYVDGKVKGLKDEKGK